MRAFIFRSKAARIGLAVCIVAGALLAWLSSSSDEPRSMSASAPAPAVRSTPENSRIPSQTASYAATSPQGEASPEAFPPPLRMRSALPPSIRDSVELRAVNEARTRVGLTRFFEAYLDNAPIEGTRASRVVDAHTGRVIDESVGLPLQDYAVESTRFPNRGDNALESSLRAQLRGDDVVVKSVTFSHRSWLVDSGSRTIRPVMSYRVEFQSGKKTREEIWSIDAETGTLLRKRSARKVL